MINESINNPSVTPPKSTEPLGPGGSEAGLDLNKQGTPSFSSGSGKGSSSGLQEMTTPMELSATSSGSQPISSASIESLGKTAGNINNNLNPLINKLETFQTQNPNTDFKSSYADIANTHIERSIQAQNSIAGNLGLEKLDLPPASSQLVHFLNYLTGSQQQMEKIQQALSSAPPGSLQPGALLSLQVKMNTVQQQVEFFTTMIGKGTDDFKTIMNIQT